MNPSEDGSRATEGGKRCPISVTEETQCCASIGEVVLSRVTKPHRRASHSVCLQSERARTAWNFPW